MIQRGLKACAFFITLGAIAPMLSGSMANAQSPEKDHKAMPPMAWLAQKAGVEDFATLDRKRSHTFNDKVKFKASGGSSNEGTDRISMRVSDQTLAKSLEDDITEAYGSPDAIETGIKTWQVLKGRRTIRLRQVSDNIVIISVEKFDDPNGARLSAMSSNIQGFE